MNTTTGPRCAVCNDSGRRPGSDYNDCTAADCMAAAERVELERFVKVFGPAALGPDTDVVAWAIHRRATAAGEARIAELEAENARLRALAGDAADVFALMLKGCREQSFKGYQNGNGSDVGAKIEAVRKRLGAAEGEPQRAAAPVSASPQQAATAVATWRDRVSGDFDNNDAIRAMKAEIADLRAILAASHQAAAGAEGADEGWVVNEGWAPVIEAELRDGSLLVVGMESRLCWEVTDVDDPCDILRARLSLAAPSTSQPAREGE